MQPYFAVSSAHLEYTIGIDQESVNTTHGFSSDTQYKTAVMCIVAPMRQVDLMMETYSDRWVEFCVNTINL